MDDSSAEPRPVLFLHIPKTAGTSFLLTIQNTFGDNRVRRIAGAHENIGQAIDDLMETGLDRISCLAGHFPIFYFLPFLDKFLPFTILRHPVERVISLYRFLKQREPTEHQRLWLPRDFSLNDLTNSRHPELYGQVNDGMVRMLCGDPRFYDWESSQFWETGRDLGVLEQAVANLKRIDFGLAGDMKRTLALAQRRWSIPYPLPEFYENTSGNHRAVDITDIRRIVSKNGLDLSLYRQAMAIFRTRTGPLPSAPMGAAWNANSVFDPPMGKEIGVGEVPGRQGFYEFEPSTQLAWLHPERPASIHFLARRNQLHLSLNFYMPVLGYPVTDIVLRVNQQVVEYQMSDTEDGWFRLWVDQLDVPIGINCITVEAPMFIPVAELDEGSKDGRRLGIALAKILVDSTDAPSSGNDVSGRQLVS